MDKYVKGTADPTASNLRAIANQVPEVSCEWLLMGEGNMLKEENKDVKRMNAMMDTIELLNEKIVEQREKIKELESKIKS